MYRRIIACLKSYPATLTLTVANFLMFAVRQYLGKAFVINFSCYSLYSLKNPLGIVLSIFLHADISHLLINMALFIPVAHIVERIMGSLRYAFYVISTAIINNVLVSIFLALFSPGMEFGYVGFSTAVLASIVAFSILTNNNLIKALVAILFVLTALLFYVEPAYKLWSIVHFSGILVGILATYLLPYISRFFIKFLGSLSICSRNSPPQRK